MRVAIEYVLNRVELERLDRLQVFAKGPGGAPGGKLATAEGVEQVLDLLRELPGNVSGDMVLRVWRHRPELRKPKVHEAAYVWTVAGTLQSGAAMNGGGGNGPSWREYVDLKLQLARQELETKYAGKDDGFSMRDLAPVLSGLLARLGQPAAPVTGAAAAPAPMPPASAASEQDPDELRAILADVVRFYRRNPEQARQFAPMLRDMANTATHGQA